MQILWIGNFYPLEIAYILCHFALCHILSIHNLSQGLHKNVVSDSGALCTEFEELFEMCNLLGALQNNIG